MSSKEKSMRADVVVFITLPASALRTELLVNNNEEIPSGTIDGNRMIAYFAKYQLAIQLQLAIDFPRTLILSSETMTLSARRLFCKKIYLIDK